MLEELSRLAKGGVTGDAMVAGVGLVLADGDGLEEERATVHVDIEKSGVPVAATDVALLDAKGAASVEVAEDAAEEVDASGEAAVDFDKALHAGVNEHEAFHVMKNLGRMTRGVEGRIGDEAKLDGVAILTGPVKDEGVRKHFEESLLLADVVLAFFCGVGDLGGIGEEVFDSRVFRGDLVLSERMAVDGEQAMNFAIARLEDVEELAASVFDASFVIAPVAVVGALSVEFVPDDFAGELVCVLGLRSGRRGGEGGREQHQRGRKQNERERQGIRAGFVCEAW